MSETSDESFARCPRCGKPSDAPSQSGRRTYTADVCTPCEVAMDAELASQSPASGEGGGAG